MAVKRIVDVNFWKDSYVIDKYSVEDKYFLLYLMTNPHSTQLGIYSLPKKVMSFETGYTVDSINVLLDRFSEKYKNIIYNIETQEVTILNSLKYSIVKGGKPVQDLLEREISEVECDELISNTYYHLHSFWEKSRRIFDTTIQEIFESEMMRRNIHIENKNVIESENHNEIIKENKNINDNNNHNNNVINNDDQNNNDNEESVHDSLDDSDKTVSDMIFDAIHGDTVNALEYYTKKFGPADSQLSNHLSYWTQQLSHRLVIEALNRSETAESPIKYATTILKAWKDKGVKTLEEIKKLDKMHQNKVRSSKNTHKEIIPDWAK